MRQFLRHGLRLALLGVLMGCVLSLLSSRLLSSALYGLEASDPVTLHMAGVLIVVAAGACLAPAMRAARLNPSEALRQE